MTKQITGTEAALMEVRGEGKFSIEGRKIVFRADSMVWEWSHRTAAEAATILRVLRAAPKYMVA